MESKITPRPDRLKQESDSGYAAAFAAGLVARYRAVLAAQAPQTAPVLTHRLSLQDAPDKAAQAESELLQDLRKAALASGLISEVS